MTGNPDSNQRDDSGQSVVTALRSRAQQLGFIACGITDLSPTPHADELDTWLASGMAGTMRYLHRQSSKRKNPGLIVEGARTAVVLLDNYYHQAPSNSPAPRVARYAVGQDYHRVTMGRLEKLASLLLQQGAEVARCYTDAGPVPERELAQRAGLGWIGKNTMLISPGAGSYTFIGVVLTDLELPLDDPFEADHCGTCRRCLDACPTEAFPEARVLDATRCISYLTIEHRGSIPERLTERFEGWGFGCDICNEVCPWNIKFAEPTQIAEFMPREVWRQAGRDYFEGLTPDEFEDRFGDTPLERPGLEGMRRNWRAAFDSVRRSDRTGQ